MSIQGATFPFPAYLRSPLQINGPLLTISLLLLFGGMVVLASASVSVSDRSFGDPFFYLERQAVAALIGLTIGGMCLFIPMRLWQSLSLLFVLIALALLILVLLPGIGSTVNGSTRWLRLPFMNVQVSEPARLCMMIYLAGYLVRRNRSLREEFTGFLRPMVLLTFACLLLLSEPDFGAAIVLLATSLAMLFVAGARIRDFLLFFVAAVVAMALLAITSPYRMKRLTGFLDPWSDPFDSGFQLTQSLIAIGRGEWLGVGLGSSVQKLFYLPEAHTDFVFAVFAEEFGLLGCVVLIGLFLALLWRIFALARHAASVERFFEAYLAIGIGTWIGFQAFINIGVNMGLLPTKGLTLPLVSYGRSSLIVALISIGILLRIHHELVTDSQPLNRRRVESRAGGRER
jgi:cell division protein FtsW